MSVSCLETTRAYGENKVLLNQLNLLKRENDLAIALLSQRTVALAINMSGINMTDKIMLILTEINHVTMKGIIARRC